MKRSDLRSPPITLLSFTTHRAYFAKFVSMAFPKPEMGDSSIVSQLEIYDCRGGNNGWFTGYEIGVVLPLLNSL